MRQGLPGAVRGRALPDGFSQARHGACAQALAWRLGVVSGRGVAVIGQSVPMHLWLWQPARAEGCRSLTERVERVEGWGRDLGSVPGPERTERTEEARLPEAVRGTSVSRCPAE